MMTWDKPLFLVCVALLLLGLVMIYSASIALPESPRYKNLKPTATYFLVKQAIFIVIGGVAALIAFRIPIAKWQRWSPYLFIATIVLLVAVMVPGIGPRINGAKRWITLYVLNLQPSEVMKLMVVLYAARLHGPQAGIDASLRQGASCRWPRWCCWSAHCCSSSPISARSW